MSQDVFQMKMDLIMERCPGVISIHDDIVVYGTSKEDDDANLINLLNVAQVEGLVLNSKKLELKHPRVSFFGAEYSIEGMHPCLKKIQGITDDNKELVPWCMVYVYSVKCQVYPRVSNIECLSGGKWLLYTTAHWP